MTGNVDLGDELEAFVQSLLNESLYGSRDEALREGSKLLRERQAKLARFDAEIQKGFDDIDAGRTRPAEEVFAELRARYLAMAEQRSAA